MKRHFPTYEEQSGEQQGQLIKTTRFAKSLCVSNINAQVPDDVLTNELLSTFQQFGDLTVKIAGYMGRRVAYLNFFDEKSATDAYERFLAKAIPLVDRGVHIEPVIGGRQRVPRDANHNKMTERYSHPKQLGEMRSARRDAPEGKTHRYAHHLDRTLPEDDPNATRTLFVGNLDPNITKEDIIKAFSSYGVLLDVDIKWSGGPNSAARTTQNPVCFAFIRFRTVDEAYSAKLGMSGQMLLTHTVKIGYGKMVPSSCLWVGNIAPSTNPSEIETEFAKFGQILRFKVESTFNSKERFAILLFDSNEVAGYAASKMRAYRFPRTNRRLRVDFIGPDEFDQYVGSPPDGADETGNDLSVKMEVSDTAENKAQTVPTDADLARLTSIKQATTMSELCSLLPRVWSGQFLVKSSLFLTDLYVFAGDGELVAPHFGGNSSQLVKLGQRVSITDSHMNELRRRCQASRGSYCVLLATSSNDSALLGRARRNPNQQLTIRPLRALSLYLQSKSTMAIFMLQSSPFPTTVVLCYVLPHCQYSEQLLTKHCNNVTFEKEHSKDDYLMVICFRSAPLHG